MYIIVNKYDERLYQCGSFASRDDAYRVCRKVAEQHPTWGVTVSELEEEPVF